MNRIIAVLVCVTVVIGGIAQQLCFEDTTLGGWIPFVLLTAGPMYGFICGRVSAA